MLEVSAMSCGYGDIVAVRELTIRVGRGEILGLIGANGAGKTSTIMTIAGLIAARSGSLTLNGVDITRLPVHKRIDHGLALVPEGRRIFAALSVDENLTVGGTRHDRKTLQQCRQQVYDIFPRLAQRKGQLAGSLSGGEQQMLAMGRAVMARPQLLLVDELSLGLMPLVIDECYQIIHRLRQENMAILLVEQNTERVLKTANRIAVMESGRLVWSGSGKEARENNTLFDAYLGTVSH